MGLVKCYVEGQELGCLGTAAHFGLMQTHCKRKRTFAAFDNRESSQDVIDAKNELGIALLYIVRGDREDNEAFKNMDGRTRHAKMMG